MNKLSLRLKLIGAFLFLTLLVTGASIYTIFGIYHTKDLFRDIVNNDLKRIEALQEIEFITTDAQRSVYGDRLGVATTKNETVHAHLQNQTAELARWITTYNELGKDEISSNNQQSFEQIAKLSEQLMQTAQAGIAPNLSADEQKALHAKLTQDGQQLQILVDQVLQAERTAVADEDRNVDTIVTQLTLIATVATGGAFVVAMLLGVIVASSLSLRVLRIKEGADSIAAGNFSKNIGVETHDELGSVAQAFNTMASSLRDSYSRIALEKERDETLLKNMSEGLIALDETGKIALINNVALQLLQLDSQQAIGKVFAELVQLTDEKEAPLKPEQQPMHRILVGDQAVNEAFSYKTKEQQHRMLINISGSPIKVSQRISGAILVLRDVTKEKEIDRMKTEFISLASHQLRTPLSAIKWFSEMLLAGDAGKLSGDQLDFTKNISDSTDRMIELVNSLLNISRIESGRIIVDPRPTDLQELVKGIVNDLKAKTEERQQALIISVHSDLPKINLDPRLIGQVYLNLLTNAIKYTPKKGEISVFISKKGNDVISQVTDNGYGIPKAQQARIFQKFFRAENIVKHETDGTGLGLYLIKAIVESSGGKIWFESEENKGTTFWFSLPLSGMQARAGEVTLDM